MSRTRALVGVVMALVLAGCSSSSSGTATGSGSTGATTAASGSTGASTGGSTTGTGGTTGGSTSATTSGSTSGGSTSATSGGSGLTFTGFNAFTAQTSFYTWGTFSDGGLDKRSVVVLGVDRSLTCAELFSDGGLNTGAVKVVEVGVLFAQGEAQAGTYDVHELFATLFTPELTDGGGGLVIGLERFADGGSQLLYDGTQGTVTVSQPDGVNHLTGSFDTQMVADAGTPQTVGTLSGSFDVPYCQSR